MIACLPPPHKILPRIRWSNWAHKPISHYFHGPRIKPLYPVSRSFRRAWLTTLPLALMHWRPLNYQSNFSSLLRYQSYTKQHKTECLNAQLICTLLGCRLALLIPDWSLFSRQVFPPPYHYESPGAILRADFNGRIAAHSSEPRSSRTPNSFQTVIRRPLNSKTFFCITFDIPIR